MGLPLTPGGCEGLFTVQQDGNTKLFEQIGKAQSTAHCLSSDSLTLEIICYLLNDQLFSCLTYFADQFQQQKVNEEEKFLAIGDLAVNRVSRIGYQARKSVLAKDCG